MLCRLQFDEEALLLHYAHSERLSNIKGYQEKPIHLVSRVPKSNPLKHPSYIVRRSPNQSQSSCRLL